MPHQAGAYRLTPRVTGTICLGFGNEDFLLLDGQGHAVVGEYGRPPACMGKIGRGAALMGWSAGMAHVVRRCICNCHNSICNRHGRAMPPATRDLTHVLPVFVEAARGCAEEAEALEVATFDGWISRFTRPKQAAIRESIRREEVNFGRVKAFIKNEVCTKIPSKGRLIQCSPNYATQAETGPACASLQKAVFSRFNRVQLSPRIDLTVASGMNASDIGDWMNWVVSRGAKRFYERDGACWDSTMQKIHADFRQDFYRCLNPKFAEQMRAQNCVRGGCSYKDGYLPYSVNYTVKSGHNDTSFGNGVVNGGITFAVLDELGYRASIIVAGDDLLVAIYDDDIDVAKIMSLEREYGISPEAGLFSDPCHTSFVSGIFVHDGVKIHFVPSPGRLVVRLWWTVKPPSAAREPEYVRGVALGLKDVVTGIPVLEKFVNRFASSGPSIKSDKGYIFKNSSNEFAPGIRAHFLQRYGLSAADLASLESYLDSLPAEPLLIVHPVLDQIIEIDTAAVEVRGRGVWANC